MALFWYDIASFTLEIFNLPREDRELAKVVDGRLLQDLGKNQNRNLTLCSVLVILPQ